MAKFLCEMSGLSWHRIEFGFAFFAQDQSALKEKLILCDLGYAEIVLKSC